MNTLKFAVNTDGLAEAIKDQLMRKDNPTYKDQEWPWNGKEYNRKTREQVGTGFGATFFYHALGDLKNYVSNHLDDAHSYTLVSLGDAEKFDDSNKVLRIGHTKIVLKTVLKFGRRLFITF